VKKNQQVPRKDRNATSKATPGTYYWSWIFSAFAGRFFKRKARILGLPRRIILWGAGGFS
jgi:hypothetical protein